MGDQELSAKSYSRKCYTLSREANLFSAQTLFPHTRFYFTVSVKFVGPSFGLVVVVDMVTVPALAPVV